MEKKIPRMIGMFYGPDGAGEHYTTAANAGSDEKKKHTVKEIFSQKVAKETRNGVCDSDDDSDDECEFSDASDSLDIVRKADPKVRSTGVKRKGFGLTSTEHLTIEDELVSTQQLSDRFYRKLLAQDKEIAQYLNIIALQKKQISSLKMTADNAQEREKQEIEKRQKAETAAQDVKEAAAEVENERAKESEYMKRMMDAFATEMQTQLAEALAKSRAEVDARLELAMKVLISQQQKTNTANERISHFVDAHNQKASENWGFGNLNLNSPTAEAGVGNPTPQNAVPMENMTFGKTTGFGEPTFSQSRAFAQANQQTSAGYVDPAYHTKQLLKMPAMILFNPDKALTDETFIAAVEFMDVWRYYSDDLFRAASPDAKRTTFVQCLQGTALKEVRDKRNKTLEENMAWFENKYCVPPRRFQMTAHFVKLRQLRSMDDYITAFKKLVLVNKNLPDARLQLSDDTINTYFIEGVKNPQMRYFLGYFSRDINLEDPLEQTFEQAREWSKGGIPPFMEGMVAAQTPPVPVSTRPVYRNPGGRSEQLQPSRASFNAWKENKNSNKPWNNGNSQRPFSAQRPQNAYGQPKPPYVPPHYRAPAPTPGSFKPPALPSDTDAMQIDRVQLEWEQDHEEAECDDDLVPDDVEEMYRSMYDLIYSELHQTVDSEAEPAETKNGGGQQ